MTKKLAIALYFLVLTSVLLVHPASAQTTTTGTSSTSTASTSATTTTATASTSSSTSLFTAAAGAISIALNGTTNVGVENVNSLAATPKIKIEETNLISSGASLNGYYGGASYTTTADKWIGAHTLFPTKTFAFYARAAAGAVQNTNVSKSHFSAKAAGGILYDPTSSKHFTLTAGEIGYLNAPGFGKHPNGWTFKSGAAWTF
jgi:hypothetical protein